MNQVGARAIRLFRQGLHPFRRRYARRNDECRATPRGSKDTVMSSRTNSGRRQQRNFLVAAVSLLAIVWCIQQAPGQGATEYFSIPYPAEFWIKDPMTGADKLDEKGRIKAITDLKKQVVMGTLPYAANADKFTYYYDKYFFPGFSQVEQLNKLPEKRQELIEDLRKAINAKDVHDFLLAKAQYYMKGFITAPRNFHPAVRFNAMLVIGDLNADEKGIRNGVPQNFPNPLPSALDFMLQEYQKPTQLDGVKLAALIGILRHAQLDWGRVDANKIPPATRQQIAQLMLALINAKQPPAGRKPEGHVWMQRRAVEIVAALGLVGTNDPVNQAISGLVRDHNADLSLRLTAAEALGKIYVKPPAKSTIDPAKESLQLAALLVETCRQEIDRIDAWQKKKNPLFGDPSMGGSGMAGMMSGMGGAGMMPGMSSGGSSDISYEAGAAAGLGLGSESGAGGMMMTTGPKDPVVELFRRQLKYEVECVKRGIAGVSRLVVVPSSRKHPFDDLNKDINAVWTATDPTASTLPVLQKSLKDSLKGLETKTAALLPKPKAETPAEPEADLPEGPSSAPAIPAAATGVGATSAKGPATPAVARPATPAVTAPGTGARPTTPAVATPATGVGAGKAAVPTAPPAAATPPAGAPAAPAAPAADVPGP